MDGFKAPSFSLGLDEEIYQCPGSHAVAPPSNPFRISARNENRIVSKATDIASVNAMGSTDRDLEFEIPFPKSPQRIMKRLKLKSGQSTSAPSYPLQQAHEANDASKSSVMGSQNLCKRLNEKKTSLHETKTGLTRKLPTWKSAESNKKTLQNFWQGLSDKAAPKSPADSGCKNLSESKARCIEQGSCQPTTKIPKDCLARINESQTGASQVCVGTTLDFSSGQHSLVGKAGLSQGYAEGSCTEKEGLPSQRTYDKKEDSHGKWGPCRDETLQSFESCIDVDTIEELPNRNPKQGGDTTLGSSMNSRHNQKAGFQQGVATSGKGKTQTFQTNLGEDCDYLDDFSFANSVEKTGAPVQSSWRGLDSNLSDDSSTKCGLQNSRKSVEVSKMTAKDQVLDSDIQQTEKEVVDTCQTRTNALDSFWRSLTEKKSTDIGAEDDDIENCSSDNDFEIDTQSAKKGSKFGNTTARKTAGLRNVAADHIFSQSSAYPHSFGASAKTTANNCSVFQYLPSKVMADARGIPNSAASTFSASPRTFSSSPRPHQSFVEAASRVDPVHSHDTFQTKQSNLSAKAGAKLTNIPWPCSDDDNGDAFFFPRDCNENGAFDDCGASAHASSGKASQFGGSSSSFVNPVFRNDSRIANLLQVRFPHFRSITALMQGGFPGSEHVYINYGNQFSGGKGTSCQSGPSVFKQEARQTASKSGRKWGQASQKKQKVAMADNDGWIQTGNRNSTRNRAMKRKRGHKGKHESPQTPVDTNFSSGVGAGHWVTEHSGKRIYVTKDGQKLSGSSAYKQHMKDSGKHFKKTKRRRLWKAK